VILNSAIMHVVKTIVDSVHTCDLHLHKLVSAYPNDY